MLAAQSNEVVLSLNRAHLAEFLNAHCVALAFLTLIILIIARLQTMSSIRFAYDSKGFLDCSGYGNLAAPAIEERLFVLCQALVSR